MHCTPVTRRAGLAAKDRRVPYGPPLRGNPQTAGVGRLAAPSALPADPLGRLATGCDRLVVRR